MADNTDISQFIPEVGPETGTGQISQLVGEAGAAEGSGQVAQLMTETGSAESDAIISQLPIEVGANASGTIISQLTIELGRGPEVIPPDDSPPGTFQFDIFGGGLGVSYYLVPMLTDSGSELRDKKVKAVTFVGKNTNANLGVWGYGATEAIDDEAIEAGNLGSLTGPIQIPDCVEVTRTQRFPVNCPKLAVHTVRIEGRWDGLGIRDRIDEIIVEVVEQGARR